jgi:hypothetical protein
MATGSQNALTQSPFALHGLPWVPAPVAVAVQPATICELPTPTAAATRYAHVGVSPLQSAVWRHAVQGLPNGQAALAPQKPT